MTHARKQNDAGNKSGRESLGEIVLLIIITNRKQIKKSKWAVHNNQVKGFTIKKSVQKIEQINRQ